MRTFRRNALYAALLGSCVLAAPGIVSAQDAAAPPSSKSSSGTDDQSSQDGGKSAPKAVKDLGAVNVTGNTVNKLAPSAAPLEAAQPTSVIDELQSTRTTELITGTPDSTPQP